MTDKLKFFSPEWCNAAIAAINANPEFSAGLKDPSTFTNKMEFGVIDREGLVSHVESVEGRVESWTPRTFDEGELWMIINASLKTWQTAAEGREGGEKLLMTGQIKLAKGPVAAVVENSEALNVFLRTWGEIPTDWDV